MQTQDYVTVAISLITITGGAFAGIKWIVKHYLAELKPNSGSSLKDSVNRLENKVELLHDLVIQLAKN